VTGYIEPLPADHPTKFEFDNQIVGNAIPPNFIPACEKGFREAVNAGSLIGHPVEVSAASGGKGASGPGARLVCRGLVWARGARVVCAPLRPLGLLLPLSHLHTACMLLGPPRHASNPPQEHARRA
jgi:hypothetical protein